jgi:3-methyladenine DNA glycosylase/8-oxoguanine DNA glycosylase
MPTRRLVPEPPYDLQDTVRFLRTGHRDPTFHRHDDGFTRAAHYPSGPATLRVRVDGDGIVGEAWGTGAHEALEALPRLVGAHESPWQLPSHPRLRDLALRHAGLRLVDTGDVWEAVVNLVLQQLVTWPEAASAWRRLCELASDDAPGPVRMGLPPTPAQLRRLSLAQVESCGIARRRATTLLRAASVALRLAQARDLDDDDALRRLCAVPGIGPWTANSVLGHRLGRPDVVIPGDFHLPNTVVWALHGRPRGTDEELYEALEPFAGQRFRVIRLLMSGGVSAPKRGPRHALRWH